MVLPRKSNWFLTGSELIIWSPRTTIWLQVEEYCYNWIFIGWKLVRCVFKLQYRCSAFSFEPIRNKGCFPIAKYALETRCWCQNSTIRSSVCRCSRLKFLRACWDMLLRELIFWKVGGARYRVPSDLYDFSRLGFLVGFTHPFPSIELFDFSGM